jgi:hypothetical protein
MPFLLLLLLALAVGFVVGLIVWRYPGIARPSPAPPLATARKVGERVGRHPRLRAFLDARLDPATATGLALTLALSSQSAEGCCSECSLTWCAQTRI